MSQQPLTSAEESDGLIHALLLDGEGGARRLTWNDLARWSPEDGTVWVHLDRTKERTRQWLETESGLDRTIIGGLLSGSTRPRCVVEDEGLFITLRAVNLNPGADPEDMVSVRIWADRGRLITLRRERLLATDDVVDELNRGKGPVAIGDTLTRLVLRLIERIEPVVEDVAETLDDLEDEIIDPDRDSSRPRLIDVRRTLIALHRFLAPERLAMSSLSGVQHEVLSDDDRAVLRELANRLTRCLEDLEAARERAMVLQDEIGSQLNERLETRIYILTVVAAVVLPLTLLTGLLGMNVGGIPLADSEWGLWIVTAVMLAIGVVLTVVFRRGKWL